MGRRIRDKQLLYHLTSLDNLGKILRRGLLPRGQLCKFDDVASQEIIDFRRDAGLNDYVPFHFFSKNPFDGRVQKDYPEKIFIYICVNRTYARNHDFKILTMHPIALGPDFVLHNYDEGMNCIDWDTMEKTDYHNDYCRHVCMAECLCDHAIDSDDFSHVFVRTELVKDHVERKCNEILGYIPFNVNVNYYMFVE